MTQSPAGLSFDQARALISEIAAAHRLESEMLALPRCHARVLAQDVHTASIGVANTVIPSGTPMTPARVALAASHGIASLSVARRPTVAVFTIGDELVEPGLPLATGQRYDGNRELLMGLLRADGLEPTAWPRLRDDPRQVEIALRDAGCAFDLIVVCGSTSSGESHPVADVVARFGGVHFLGVRMETGSAVLFGSLDQARVLGLPSDPLAVLATWLTLGRALIDGLQGRTESRPMLQARLASPIDKPHPRRAFLAAWMGAGSTGLQIDPRSPGLPEANALVVVPEDARQIPAGTIVDVISL